MLKDDLMIKGKFFILKVNSCNFPCLVYLSCTNFTIKSTVCVIMAVIHFHVGYKNACASSSNVLSTKLFFVFFYTLQTRNEIN